MNVFEVMGIFLLGSIFNVVMIVIATKSVIKSAGVQANTVVLSIKSIVDKVVNDGK